MRGLGTIINVAAIIAGGLIGIFFKRYIKEHYQETIIKVTGISVIFLGAAGSLSKMLAVNPATGALETQKSLMMILSLVLGALIGEIINIEGAFERLGEWLKMKSGSSGDTRFLDAFLTASFTVCIGAMAIIGAIEDGLYGDHSILVAKAILDLVIIVIMAAAMGKGCIFSAVPVGILQGSVTLLSGLLAPVMTAGAADNLSLVGNILIFCVGLNLIRPKTVRVANLLPAIVIAAAFAFVPGMG